MTYLFRRESMPKLIILMASITLTLPLFFTTAEAKLRGKVRIDGSSTVFPITEAVAEEFRNKAPRVRVNIGVSGTGGGFKKFIKNEIDINNASRRIKDKEKQMASEAGIKYMEIPIAFDGITVVINPKNTWATQMTKEQLTQLWQTGSKVKTWKDLNEKWPNRAIKLYGPGTDSGTFDYFTKVINGKSGKSRANYSKSEDDNVLVTGVAGDIDALGYFGYAYYAENKNSLKAVSIDGVAPTEKTIQSGTYTPLARQIFIYVNTNSLKREEMKTFVEFYLSNAANLVKDVGYVPLTKDQYNKYLKEL